jgi:site-specific recombinase XerD
LELIKHNKEESLLLFGNHSQKVILETDSKPYSEDCQIAAKNDIEAVRCWLKRHNNNTHTLSAYYKESRRLLLWCVYERGLTLGQLKVQDVETYFTFLKSPPAHWCEGGARPTSEQWRPLKGALSESACRMSMRTLNALFNYLVEADYVRTNPLKLLNSALVRTLDQEIQKYKVWERMLEVDEWEAVQQVLHTMSAETLTEIDNKMRTQFLFALLYLLGLRINEVALSSWNAFRKREGSWWFFIKGKGGKPGHVPVNDQLLSYVKSYRLHLGLPPLPHLEETKNLFISKKTKRPLKVRQLYGLVKAVGQNASTAFEDKPLKKKKLEQLSPHWLRHLSASHQDKAGIPVTVIQANHRHRSSQTTQIYLHAEDALRSTEIQKLRMRLEPELIVKTVIAEKVKLNLRFKGGALSHEISLSRLLASIEENILRGIAFEREGPDLAELLRHYERLKKFGEALTVSYALNDFKAQRLGDIQKAIIREASIRLFECSISVQKESNNFLRTEQ